MACGTSHNASAARMVLGSVLQFQRRTCFVHRCWLPCMDESHQRGIFDISLIAPEGFDVACTGERVLQQTTLSGTVIHRFVTSNRVPARAVGFFVGRVQRRSEERRVGKEWVSTVRSRWAPVY